MELNTRGTEQTCTAEMFTSRLVVTDVTQLSALCQPKAAFMSGPAPLLCRVPLALPGTVARSPDHHRWSPWVLQGCDAI